MVSMKTVEHGKGYIVTAKVVGISDTVTELRTEYEIQHTYAFEISHDRYAQAAAGPE